MEPTIFIVAGGVAVAAVGAWSIYRERRRTTQLAVAAQALDFRFEPNAESLSLSRFGGFELFDRGRRQKIFNLISGDRREFPVMIFDYRYQIKSGKNSSTHYQTVAAFQFPGGEIPRFTLRPEHLGHRIIQGLGFPDIDFDEHPTFSKSYLLQGPHEPSVRRIFAPDVRAALEQRPGWCVEGMHDLVIVYRSGTRTKHDDMRQFLGQTTEIAALFYRESYA